MVSGVFIFSPKPFLVVAFTADNTARPLRARCRARCRASILTAGRRAASLVIWPRWPEIESCAMFRNLPESSREGVMILIRGLAAGLFFVFLLGCAVDINALAVPLCFIAGIGFVVWSSLINLDIELERKWREGGEIVAAAVDNPEPR